MKANRKQIETRFRRLRSQLAQIGWISQGYVQDRGPGAGGPCYQWTRKERGKTISVALSKEQFTALDHAIENWRQVEKTLDQMQAATREMIFATLPDIQRRKPLSKKVLGIK
jgi:hypothetical protein